MSEPQTQLSSPTTNTTPLPKPGQIGFPVTRTTPALHPKPITLHGKTIHLVPLNPSHAPSLFEVVGGTQNAHLWTYMFDGPYPTLPPYQESLTTKSSSTDPLFFTVISNTTRQPIGTASYLRIDPANRVIEVGHILFSPLLQRSTAATETMYLLARHAFEDLGYRRYEWKCDALNIPSRKAASRLGFGFEGVFRQHMVYKGRNRDTAWFGMLDWEWDGKYKGMLERWLDEENFDGEGKQKRKLQECL